MPIKGLTNNIMIVIKNRFVKYFSKLNHLYGYFKGSGIVTAALTRTVRLIVLIFRLKEINHQVVQAFQVFHVIGHHPFHDYPSLFVTHVNLVNPVD